MLKTILIDIIPPDFPEEVAEKRLSELDSLVQTFGGIAVVKTIQKRARPDYETYIGKGKLEEIKEIAKNHKAALLITNNILKPRQIFKLNEIFRKAKLETRAWDRVDLILKIFSRHAQSTEAKLEIELASLKHMGPRIFDMGIELSRQGGAMGMRAGQGESNTEMMKRHLRTQELNLLEKLRHYELIREGHRKRRKRSNFKTAALVGYTNAGKSSLLNALTNKGAYVADKLFATLDTRVGKMHVPDTFSEILVSDTIGFIQDLPPQLIKAFKSTLSETVDADLLLHVIDLSDQDLGHKIDVVEEILQQLNVSDKPKIYVFNKSDLIHPGRNPALGKIEEKSTSPRPKGILKSGPATIEYLGWAKTPLPNIIRDTNLLKRKYKKFLPLFVSAATGTNLLALKQKIAELAGISQK